MFTFLYFLILAVFKNLQNTEDNICFYQESEGTFLMHVVLLAPFFFLLPD